ncbi:hypothetical protein [Virgibacillus oceani]|uniref:Uncharacterized protein n=1 Tax=Virgibacillus oceani TaxID=1479511 RepID=A0A917HGE3_9BACI|nr:hypothetical protein [Virgibacillus oceani]GGG77236.1 hypothetical protein GCM10011398_22880 [Virgibacillus oceani]
MSTSWAEYLDGFIQGVEKFYSDKQKYFDKMTDVRKALKTHSYEPIPNLINEAKEFSEG